MGEPLRPNVIAPPPLAAVPQPTVGHRELALWMAAFLSMAALRIALVGGPQFFNDSYQYLSMVDNLRHHHSLSTAIAHFDTERARLRLPAPETTFAPGYPILIWAFWWTGLAPEWIGLLLSLLSALSVLPLLRAAARALRLPADAARLCLLLWTLSAQASLYAITLYAEAAFTAAVLAAIVLLLGRQGESAGARWREPAAFLIIGLSYAIRYAGLLFVLAFHIHALVAMWQRQPQRLRWALSLCCCDALITLIMIRNAVVAGTWMGGNTRTAPHGLSDVLRRLGVAAYELAVGSVQHRPPPQLLVFAALLCAGAAATSACAIRAYLSFSRKRSHSTAEPARVALLSLCAFVYISGMSYLGLRTQVSLCSRMFVPLLPVLALLAALFLASAPREPFTPRILRKALAVMFVVGYAGANLISTVHRPWVAAHLVVAERLKLPTPSGEPLSRWIDSSIPPNAVLMSLEGQATGYLLRRKTVSAPGRDFTALSWDEADVQLVMSQFGAQHLIVFPEVVESGGLDHLDSELFRRLAARRPPDWLELVAENARTLVFRRVPEATHRQDDESNQPPSRRHL